MKIVQWKPSYSMQTDEQTGMTKPTAAFYNFGKVPKITGKKLPSHT